MASVISRKNILPIDLTKEMVGVSNIFFCNYFWSVYKERAFLTQSSNTNICVADY